MPIMLEARLNVMVMHRHCSPGVCMQNITIMP